MALQKLVNYHRALQPRFARRGIVRQFIHVPPSANAAIFEMLRRFISIIW
jgi:hypothetical protein